MDRGLRSDSGMSLNYNHPAVRIALWVVGGLIVLALGWFLIGRIFPDNPPGPTENETRADSLRITKPVDQALIDSSQARIVAREPSSAAADRAARSAQERANRERRRADSLAAIASTADEWRAAHDSRVIENGELRTAIVEKDKTIFNLKADTTDLRLQLGIVQRRLKTTEDVNEGLIEDLAKARRCKIVGLINCPSRIQTAALTAITVIAVQRYQSSN